MAAPTPTEIVQRLLENTLNPNVVRELVAPDATCISLTYDNPNLTKILPYAGTHANGLSYSQKHQSSRKRWCMSMAYTPPTAGPQAIIDTFATVHKIWANEAFDIQSLFSSGENVAVFGSFTYRSRSLGQACTSPFSIWCKVNAGKVTYMQFMEDTLASTDTFKKSGKKTYVVFEEEGEIDV